MIIGVKYTNIKTKRFRLKNAQIPWNTFLLCWGMFWPLAVVRSAVCLTRSRRSWGEILLIDTSLFDYLHARFLPRTTQQHRAPCSPRLFWWNVLPEWKQPSAPSVVAGTVSGGFGMKCNQIRCGGVNAESFPLQTPVFVPFITDMFQIVDLHFWTTSKPLGSQTF